MQNVLFVCRFRDENHLLSCGHYACTLIQSNSSDHAHFFPSHSLTRSLTCWARSGVVVIWLNNDSTRSGCLVLKCSLSGTTRKKPHSHQMHHHEEWEKERQNRGTRCACECMYAQTTIDWRTKGWFVTKQLKHNQVSEVWSLAWAMQPTVLVRWSWVMRREERREEEGRGGRNPQIHF